MMNEGHPELALPALRAHMGDWIYYITFLRMEDIADRVSIAEDIHSSAPLRELLQRRLTGERARTIRDYLLNQPQRFFNALVVATYGGSPQWHEIAVRDLDVGLESLMEPFEGALGILALDGSEKLFAVDGQHRVAGIKAAVKEKKKIGNEEVCVIMVTGVTQEHRSEDPAGFERTRRLFTTLNRYAKPVTKRDIIALDEDDIIAILTRKFVEEHPLFRDKVSLGRGNSILRTDKESFTAITTVYDALDIYLPRTRRGWKDRKKLRPSEAEVNSFFRRASALWDALISHYPALQQMQGSQPEDEVAGIHRGEHGGHLLFRPVGLLLVVRVIKRLVDSRVSLPQAAQRVARTPSDIAAEPWVGLLWNATNRRMITSAENQRVAERLLVYLTFGHLKQMGLSVDELTGELAGLLNKPPDEVSLPAPLPRD